MTGLPSHWRDFIVEWAEGQPAIGAVYLFGSRAKGEHRPDSDVDLALHVLPIGPSRQSLSVWVQNAKSWRETLEGRLPVKVDLDFANSDESEVVRPSVLEHGVLIFSRDR